MYSLVTCHFCGWTEKGHPDYGWQDHNTRAVIAHKTQLCPALKDELAEEDEEDV